MLKPKEQLFIKIDKPFIDDISKLVIVKKLDKKAENMMMLKPKCAQNLATLDVTNIFLDTAIFYPKEMLGILDLRSVGYYKIEARIFVIEFK